MMTDKANDTYKTIVGDAEALYKEKGSKFLCYAYHVETQEEISSYLDILHKKHYDATHHCYAWRIGTRGEQSRANDDGEPSSTAGKPILGQILSYDLTNILIVVVRYFGGTKLGVGGLIVAYKESAQCAIEAAILEERTIDAQYKVAFSYFVMNDIMKIVKDLQPKILNQDFDNLCTMTLAVREGNEVQFKSRIEDVEGVNLDFLGYK